MRRLAWGDAARRELHNPPPPSPPTCHALRASSCAWRLASCFSISAAYSAIIWGGVWMCVRVDVWCFQRNAARPSAAAALCIT